MGIVMWSLYNENLKKPLILVGFLVLLMGIMLLLTGKNDSASKAYYRTVVIKDTQVSVEVVDTPESREHGLSGKSSLPHDSGMFFVFEQAGVYPFWMKDMLFSLDMLWIGDDFSVVHIVENASPDTYPDIFDPGVPARYVLEVNAGFVKEKNIQVGDIVSLE